MKILVTGAKGFIGKNLISELVNRKYFDIFKVDIDTEEELLDRYCKECDFVFHLAGINRPKEETEFMTGNFGFTSKLLENMKKFNNKAPILITSSIQAEYNNPYGVSKKAGEELMFSYAADTGVKALVYRLPNVFGKWCRPNYNSVIATFCNNIAKGIDIHVNDLDTLLNLVYIDDVVNEFILAMEGNETKLNKFCIIPVSYNVTLGKIVELLYSFKESRSNLFISDMDDEFTKKLYGTYLTYLQPDTFGYPLKMNTDERGSFTEFIKTIDRGQISINISKQGITKGNHWHHTKNEKFLVVSGKGLIRFRKIGTDEIIEYHVNGDNLEVIDIPPGYTHSITNIGDADMVTVMWANETYTPERPDTYFMEV